MRKQLNMKRAMILKRPPSITPAQYFTLMQQRKKKKRQPQASGVGSSELRF